MALLVPTRVSFRISQPESPAQIDHFGSGREHVAREIHRTLGWRGQKDQVQLLQLDGFRRGRYGFGRLLAQWGDSLRFGIRAVF
jgi:hypothetical protein